MTKTVRQRKEELLQNLEARKNGPFVTVDSTNNTNSLYDSYKKILFSNGIKNEKVIQIQLKKMIDTNLPKATIYSNLKFMSLLRSRLVEEGIPLQDSEKILEVVNFNMSEIPEDDDYCGTFALKYAEILKLQYDALFNTGIPKFDYTPQFDSKNEELLKHFDIMNVQLPLT